MASGHIGIQSESESFAKCLKGRRDEGSVAYFVKRNSYCTTSWILTDLFLELNKNNVSQVRVALSLSLFVSLARSLSFSTSLSFPPSLLHLSLSLCLRFLFFSLSFSTIPLPEFCINRRIQLLSLFFFLSFLDIHTDLMQEEEKEMKKE